MSLQCVNVDGYGALYSVVVCVQLMRCFENIQDVRDVTTSP